MANKIKYQYHVALSKIDLYVDGHYITTVFDVHLEEMGSLVFSHRIKTSDENTIMYIGDEEELEIIR